MDKRPIDRLFDAYAGSHTNPINIGIHWVCVPLIAFSILGLIWSIPFPRLAFLGSFNGYFNWASILIAVIIYYYFRLSPMLSYFMIITVGIFSFFIVQLEYWALGDGPALWVSCLVIFVVAWLGQFLGHIVEGKKPSFLKDLTFLLIGPLWLWSKVLKKLKIPY